MVVVSPSRNHRAHVLLTDYELGLTALHLLEFLTGFIQLLFPAHSQLLL